MFAHTRFGAGLRAVGWLVRGAGLRGNVFALRDAATAACHGVERLGHRLAAAEATLAAVADRLAVSERRAAWRRAGDLRGFEDRVCSQQGEDGILAEIFRRVGTTNQYFVEFGAETGAQCNCANLARHAGWGGLFLEADPDLFAKLAANYWHHPRVRCEPACVTSANVEELFARFGVPREFDLLSIDIDGNDYWVWQAVRAYSPRVVAIEYNAAYPPPTKWVMAENPDHRWDGTTYHGASLAALYALGRAKGYTLVGTDSLGVNAFFVRHDCLGDHFLDPALHYHYTPFGHPAPPPGDGPAADIV